MEDNAGSTSDDGSGFRLEELPPLEEFNSLGLVSPGPLATDDEIQELRKTGLAFCERTGLLVSIVGAPRLASRISEKGDIDALARRIVRQSGKSIPRKLVLSVEALCLRICGRFPREVADEQQRIIKFSFRAPSGWGAPGDGRPPMPLPWAARPENRFSCLLCGCTTFSQKNLIRHISTAHANADSRGASRFPGVLEPKLLQPIFLGIPVGYVAVRAAEESVCPAEMRLSPPHREALQSVLNPGLEGQAREVQDDGAPSNIWSEDGTNFFFRSGISRCVKRLGMTAEEAYQLAKKPWAEPEEEAIRFVEEGAKTACHQCYSAMREAEADLLSVCLWKTHTAADDDAAASQRGKACLQKTTIDRYVCVVVRLVAFMARMALKREGPGRGEWCGKEFSGVTEKISELIRLCREASIDTHSENETRLLLIVSATHHLLFELLVRPIPIVRLGVSPLFAFLSASSAIQIQGGAVDWAPFSGQVTPIAAALMKGATAAAVYFVCRPSEGGSSGDCAEASTSDRVRTVRRFRQESHLEEKVAPVSEVGRVLGVGRRTLEAEHSRVTVIPCQNVSHGRCAFIGATELRLLSVGDFARNSQKQFWAFLLEDVTFGGVLGDAEMEEIWREVPRTGGIDNISEVVMPWMSGMGCEEERLCAGARSWVLARAIQCLDVQIFNGKLQARNKGAIACLKKGLRACARALMAAITFGCGAPLRATELASLNVRGGGGIARDIYFINGAFFIIPHITKSSHNFATSGEVQPRKLPPATSACLAAWCRLGLPVRDLLLECGEACLGLGGSGWGRGADLDPSRKPVLALFGSESYCVDMVNSAMSTAGLNLTLRPYRQYVSFFLREISGPMSHSASGASVLVCAAERQFGHSEETGRKFYGRIPDADKVARLLPAFAVTSENWHAATGQVSTGINATMEDPPHYASIEPGTYTPGSGTARGTKRKAADALFSISHSSTGGGPAAMVEAAAARVARVPSSFFQWTSREQEQATRCVERGLPDGDVFLVLRTGGGKFLTYATSALTHPERLIVLLVPFVALQADLHLRFKKVGIFSRDIRSLSLEDITSGCRGISVVVGGVECVESECWGQLFSCAWAKGRESIIVVEECHVLFYDRYRSISSSFGPLVRGFSGSGLVPAPPILLLSATAPPAAVPGIAAACGCDGDSIAVIRQECTIRPNIRLTVSTAAGIVDANGRSLREWVIEQVYSSARACPLRENDSAPVCFVYVETKRLVADLSASLDGAFSQVLQYHSSIGEPAKKTFFEKFSNAGRESASRTGQDSTSSLSRQKDGGLVPTAVVPRRTTVVVATLAFGAGIDVANVRCVCIIGHRTPGSMITYSQMAGRAGRDGRPALCATLLHPGAPLQSFGQNPGALSSSDGPDAVVESFAADRDAFLDFCLDSKCCRQARLHAVLDGSGPALDGSGISSLESCQGLSNTFFRGCPIEECDVCEIVPGMPLDSGVPDPSKIIDELLALTADATAENAPQNAPRGTPRRCVAPPPRSCPGEVAQAACAASLTRRQNFQRVLDEALALRDISCARCVGDLLCGGQALGEVARGSCSHGSEGCRACGETWRHIKGAAGQRAEHSYRSPACPLASLATVKGRCGFCRMGSVFAEKHQWGRQCPFYLVYRAALTLFWDAKPFLSAFVRKEARRTDSDVSETEVLLTTSITHFVRWMTRDDPMHGPPLVRLLTTRFKAWRSQ